MGTPYTPLTTTFHTSATLPDDGDEIDASNANPQVEAALDNAAFIASRTVIGAVDPTALSLITGAADFDSRVVEGYGMYRFVLGGTATLDDGLWEVNATDASGYWELVDRKVNRPGLIGQEQLVYKGAQFLIPYSGGTYTERDPINRRHGLVASAIAVSASSYTFRVGDFFRISWSVPLWLTAHPSGSGDCATDAAIGVGFVKGDRSVYKYPDQLIEAAYSEDPDIDAGGWGDGASLTCTTPDTRNVTLSRSAIWRPTSGDVSAGNTRFVVLALSTFDIALNLNNLYLLQGAVLNIEHYRGAGS